VKLPPEPILLGHKLPVRIQQRHAEQYDRTSRGLITR
jgi:hypothetical protein